ncbi:MAG: substrate-binding domain-containing protein [Burkholderiaceae bacterium]
MVALHWARREQGLLLAPGNPLGIGGLSDLTRRGCRVALRQAGAGSSLLFARLMRLAGVGFAALSPIEPRASSESDMAAMIADDFADAGFGIRSAAVAARLEFIPLAWESVDLAMWRRQAFEPGLQALLAFCRGPRFAERARRLGGYDVSGHGRVVFNA